MWVFRKLLDWINIPQNSPRGQFLAVVQIGRAFGRMDPLGLNEQYALIQAGRNYIATALEWHQHWDRRQSLATTIETNYIQTLAFNLAQTLRLSTPGLKAITINATGRILGPQSFFPIYGPFQTRKWLAVPMPLLVGPLVGQPPN